MLKKHLKQIATDFLLPTKELKPPPEHTRTDTEAYLHEKHASLIQLFKKKSEKPKKPSPKTNGKTPPPKPTPTPVPPSVSFFQDLTANIENDHKLYNLCREIRLIQYKRTPIAAFLLLRTLLQSALEYQLRRMEKLDHFEATTSDKRARLAELIKYAARKDNACFAREEVRQQLASLQQSPIKSHMDRVVHSQFGDINPAALELLKPYLRPIIEYITSGGDR